MAEFRGKVSATLFCDIQPIFDHFRKVDDDTLMGVMDEKRLLTEMEIVSNDRYFFFYLHRVAEFPAKFVNKNETNLWPVSQQAGHKG